MFFSKQDWFHTDLWLLQDHISSFDHLWMVTTLWPIIKIYMQNMNGIFTSGTSLLSSITPSNTTRVALWVMEATGVKRLPSFSTLIFDSLKTNDRNWHSRTRDIIFLFRIHFQNPAPTLPMMQLSHGVTELEAVYQSARNFLWNSWRPVAL